MQTKYTQVPGEKDLVRLFNNTAGSFIHEITLADEKTKVKYTLAGHTFAKVPKEVAEFWLKAFPNRVVTDSEAHATANAAKAELDTANKRIADLEAQLAAAQDDGKKGNGKGKAKGSDAV